MRIYPKGFGGHRDDPDRIKRQAWQDMQTLVVATDDQRLSWPEQELIKQLGEKLYGTKRKAGDQ